MSDNIIKWMTRVCGLSLVLIMLMIIDLIWTDEISVFQMKVFLTLIWSFMSSFIFGALFYLIKELRDA